MRALATIWHTPSLRAKIAITVGLLALYRLGCVLPAPGVNYGAVQRCVTQVADNSLYAVVNLFSGGALLQLSVFALGAMPYITASIVIQLLTVVVPRLDALKQEGQSGQGKLTQYTRYLTIALAVLQATTVVTLARSPGRLFSGCSETIMTNTSLTTTLVMVITMVAGTVLVMWFGEQITARGIGNGMSLLIFVSVLSSLPSQFATVLAQKGVFALSVVTAISVVVVAAVVYVEQGQRRIPVRYPKRTLAAGPGAASYIPLKVNMAGVVPVIFASSLLYLPQLIVALTGSQSGWARWISQNLASGTDPLYLVGYAILIMFFAFFYTSITFNPLEVADNLAKAGGFVPGIRPGRPTALYLAYVVTRLTWSGSLYLAVLATIPFVVFGGLGLGATFLFGGTSLLIVVGVSLDTVKQVQAQLTQQHYGGFLR